MTKKNIAAIQKEICRAGLRLVKEGLVARTWGNISIRIDKNTMAITPSGIKYEMVRPEHIAIINLEDGSYDCCVRPSGERKLHIEIYRARSDVGAVIHTHQMNASVCAAARHSVPVHDHAEQKSLGTDMVCCGGYGLPSTKKLTNESVDAIMGSMCALMANHGAVCLGKDINGAFTVAKALERVCSAFVSQHFTDATGIVRVNDAAICANYLKARALR